MEISAEKTKLMTNNNDEFNSTIKINDEPLEIVNSFKYLGAIISPEGSKKEILARIGDATSSLTKLSKIWSDRNIRMKHKVNLLRSIVISTFLYACESWTITIEL